MSQPSTVLGNAIFVVGVVVCALSVDSHAEDTVDFNRDIRPILSNHCFQCHGPDEEQRQADLRLDQRAGAIQDLGGYSAIQPNDADGSELLARVITTDEDLRMPPADHGDRLTDVQVLKLRKWIEQGAPYAEHWSFQPYSQPDVPSVPDAAPGNWKRHAIDAFVHQRLAHQAIEPSPEADRPTLIRRVSLDLLGLPPSPDAVATFIADQEPGAFERMLDRMLESKHFGERWARHWLDQARYADSHGYTNDNQRSIWPYRDWVIEAFNRDLPFDQFTIEQLAGDMLDSPTLQQRVATGFHRNTLINSEGGTKADQFRDEQVKDRIDTTGLVWMGLTVGCAKCHTHKFDPLSQQEYYQLYAFFNSTTDSNSVTPTVKVPSSEQTEQLVELRSEQERLRALLAADEGREERKRDWEAEIADSGESESEKSDGVPWTVLALSGKSDKGSEIETLEDNSLLVSGVGGEKEEYQSTARSPLTKVRSVRLEVLTDESLPKNGPGRASNGNFVLSEFWFRTGDGRELRFSKAVAEHSQPKFEIAKSIDGKTDTGWAINGAPEGSMNRNRTAWFVLPEPLEVELDHALVFKMQFHVNANYGIGRYRISISADEWIDRPDQAAIAKLLKIPVDKRSAEQRNKIERAFLQQDPKLSQIDKQLTEVEKQIDSVERQIATTMVLQELDDPRIAYIQVRGDFLRHGKVVLPDVPAVLPPLPTGTRANRLTFARWLVSSEHPLTSRVRVNRIWMRLFGRGLVETENDFGIQGSLPTHPELLNWLAAEFVNLGWSTKQLLRLIMTSATYRQQSYHRPDLESIDPRNLLLARQARLRVEAEIVRDMALTVSGALSDKIGGPGVFPPQPDGVYAFTQRKKQWKTSQGEDRYRRGMYTFFYRSAPYPMLSTFDVPKFNTTCTRRDRSNTPLQSLTLANAESFQELAGLLGQRIMRDRPRASNSNVADTSNPAAPPEHSDVQLDRRRIAYAYELCFARTPSKQESARLEQYVVLCRKKFESEERTWAAVARVLMNLDEFVTRE